MNDPAPSPTAVVFDPAARDQACPRRTPGEVTPFYRRKDLLL